MRNPHFKQPECEGIIYRSGFFLKSDKISMHTKYKYGMGGGVKMLHQDVIKLHHNLDCIKLFQYNPELIKPQGLLFLPLKKNIKKNTNSSLLF